MKINILKKIEILSTIETNSFANDRLINNGGGYSQPQIEFLYGGKKGIFSDSSCGDFGSRYSLDFNGEVFRWGSMLDDWEEHVTVDAEDLAFYKDFAKAFENAFGEEIPFLYFDGNGYRDLEV